MALTIAKRPALRKQKNATPLIKGKWSIAELEPDAGAGILYGLAMEVLDDEA